MKKASLLVSCLSIGLAVFTGCVNAGNSKGVEGTETKTGSSSTPEYFSLRPRFEKEYGYTHAVKMGDNLKISGAVSMTNSGTLIAPGNMEQQMRNCYSDLRKILEHYGYTYDDVFAENIYTTNIRSLSGCRGFAIPSIQSNS